VNVLVSETTIIELTTKSNTSPVLNSATSLASSIETRQTLKIEQPQFTTATVPAVPQTDSFDYKLVPKPNASQHSYNRIDATTRKHVEEITGVVKVFSPVYRKRTTKAAPASYNLASKTKADDYYYQNVSANIPQEQQNMTTTLRTSKPTTIQSTSVVTTRDENVRLTTIKNSIAPTRVTVAGAKTNRNTVTRARSTTTVGIAGRK